MQTKRFFVNLLCSLIPNKKCRHALRYKFNIKGKYEPKRCVTFEDKGENTKNIQGNNNNSQDQVKKKPAIVIANDSPLLETYMSIPKQDGYDLREIKKASKIVCGVESAYAKEAGGAKARYNYFKNLNNIMGDEYSFVYTTEPGEFTYATNKFVDESLQYLRWEQTRKLLYEKDEVLLMLPMTLFRRPDTNVRPFVDQLTDEDFAVLKSIKKLRILIMNGRMDMQPNRSDYAWLRMLTDDISFSVMHHKFCTQEICNQIGTPLILLPARIERLFNERTPFNQKQKLIILSPDTYRISIPQKGDFIRLLNAELPDYKVTVPYNKTPGDYERLTSVASALITFGEGLDGYFFNANRLGTAGFCVYNDEFFPDKYLSDEYKDFTAMYKSYEDLFENFVPDFKRLMSNKKKYYEHIERVNAECDLLYDFNEYLNSLKRFVARDYDFYPSSRKRLGGFFNRKVRKR